MDTELNYYDYKVQELRKNFKVDFLQKTRRREICNIRQIVQLVLRENTELSLTEIGEITGGYNHATVIHSAKSINKLMWLEPEIWYCYIAVKEKIQ